MTSGMTERILRSGSVVIIAHVIFKIAGLVQTMIIGHYFGTIETDAFVMAFEGVLFMIFLIGEESIGPAFLPVFLEERNKRSEKSAWQFINGIISIQTSLLLVVAFLLIYKGEFVIKFINYMSGKGFQCVGDKNILARNLIMIMAPGLIGLSLGSVTYMILNGYKRFFWAAFADSLTKIVIIISVLLFHENKGVLILGWGVAIGGFAKLLVHFWGLRDKLKLLFTSLPVIRSAAFRKFLVLIAPLILGILFAKVRDFFNNIVILNNVGTDGLLTANSWGRKLFNAAGWFVPYGISIAMFPYFCDMIDKDDKKALGDFITDASKMLLLFFVPLTAIGVLLSFPLVRLLFEHGKFDLSEWTSAANVCYLLVLPFYSLEYFFMQGFFADRRMITPTVLGIVCSSLSILISYVFVILLDVEVHYGPVFAIVAVALGYTISRVLKVFLLIFFFKKKIPVFETGEMRKFLLKLFLITAAVIGVTFVSREAVEWATGFMRSGERFILALQILCSSCAGAAAFLIMVRILNVREFKTAVAWAVEKVRRKKNP